MIKRRFFVLILIVTTVSAAGFTLWFKFKPKSSADVDLITNKANINLLSSSTDFAIDPANSLVFNTMGLSPTVSLFQNKTTKTQLLRATARYMGMMWLPTGGDYVSVVNDGVQTNDPNVALADVSTDSTFVSGGNGQIWYSLSKPSTIPANAVNISVNAQARTVGPNKVPPVIGLNACNGNVCTVNSPGTWTPDIINNPANTLYAGIVIPQGMTNYGMKVSRLVVSISYDVPGTYVSEGKIEAKQPQYFNTPKPQMEWYSIRAINYNPAIHKVPDGTQAIFRICAGDDMTYLTDCTEKGFSTVPGIVTLSPRPKGQYAKFALILKGGANTPIMPTQYEIDFLSPESVSTDNTYVWIGEGTDSTCGAGKAEYWSCDANWQRPIGKGAPIFPYIYFKTNPNEPVVKFLGTQDGKYPNGNKHCIIDIDTTVSELVIDGYQTETGKDGSGVIHLNPEIPLKPGLPPPTTEEMLENVRIILVKNFVQKSGQFHAAEGGFHVFNFNQEGGLFNAPLGGCTGKRYNCLWLKSNADILKETSWKVGPKASFSHAGGEVAIITDSNHTFNFDVSDNPESEFSNHNTFNQLTIRNPIDTDSLPMQSEKVTINLKSQQLFVVNNYVSVSNNLTFPLEPDNYHLTVEMPNAKFGNILLGGIGKIKYGGGLLQIKEKFQNNMDKNNLYFGADFEFVSPDVVGTIQGSTIFRKSFTVDQDAAGKIITWPAGLKQQILGTLTLKGTQDNFVKLQTSTEKSCPKEGSPGCYKDIPECVQNGLESCLMQCGQWLITTDPATADIQYAEVGDSRFTKGDGTELTAKYPSRSMCNNTSWDIKEWASSVPNL